MVVDGVPAAPVLARLAMVPIAGKYMARRAAAAPGMLQFLGGPEGVDPRAQLEALRVVAAGLATREQPRIEAAVDAYLELVASTLG
jgi:hypothetical protein